jgi:outer membrane protein OmpA-like peptidoglycan-associated protein
MAGVIWRSHMINRRFLAVLSGIFLSAMLTASVADAQHRYNLYAPGSNRPSVIVDFTVLDKLGPEPTLPKMLRPSAALSTHTITETLAPGVPTSRKSTLLPPPSEPPKSNVSIPPPAPLITKAIQAKIIAPKLSPENLAPSKIVAKPIRESVPPPMLKQMTPNITTPRIAPPKLEKLQSATSRLAKRTAVPPPPKLKKPTLPQVALVGSATSAGSNGALQIRFDVGSTDLPSNATSALNTLIKKLKGDPSLRVQLLGYASGPENTPSQARRLSLFRALSVRTRFMKSGIRSTRIDVRALGMKSGGGPKDRVDVLLPQS